MTIKLPQELIRDYQKVLASKQIHIHGILIMKINPGEASYIPEPVAFSVQREIEGKRPQAQNKIYGKRTPVPWAKVAEISLIKPSREPSVSELTQNLYSRQTRVGFLKHTKASKKTKISSRITLIIPSEI